MLWIQSLCPPTNWCSKREVNGIILQRLTSAPNFISLSLTNGWAIYIFLQNIVASYKFRSSREDLTGSQPNLNCEI